MPRVDAAKGDSERTAVFRAPKPAAGPDSETTAAVPTPKGQDSETTAVFRAPKADSAPAAQDTNTTVFRAVKPATATPKPETDQPGAAKPGTDRPGAANPAGAPGTGTAAAPGTDRPGAAKLGTDQPGAAKPGTDRPGTGNAAAAPGTGKPAPAPGKDSTFVPLRTGEAGPRFDKKVTATPPPGPAPEAATVRAPDRTERTTQQPLPPKPPLDMLADLTNNPPPPPSPLRTAVRRIKIYTPLVVLLAVVLGIVQLVRPLPEPKLVMTAKSSYTFDGGKPQLPWPAEGQAYMAAAGLGTLGQSGEQKPVPIASVTKSMTAYIILRDHPIKKGEQGAMIDVDKTAETEGKKNDSVNNESTLDTVKEGDKISEYDAIAALMIPSANNIARLLARWDAGSQEAFVKKMNDTAKELGMTNTTYTDPSGLDATTVSTAEDQVKLGLKLVEIETLLDITKKPKWTDPSGKEWRNWNGLVPFNDSLGIKTGTTTKAGGNLLFAAQKKIGNTNQLIVGAVLAQHKPPIIDSVLAASKQLLIATQKSLEGAKVVEKGQVVGYVDDGLGGRTPVVATAEVQAIGWASLTVDVKLGNGGGSSVPQTAKAGTEVGLLTVGDGASQVKVPVALQSDLAAPGIGSKLTRVG
ncbi:D-alanyl-D-alanine carboxypeptidase [Streptomyces sp. NPDC047014]|uniref:D-alanyl-D-alanine carboxypeptidase n=1 Tax=Streptomyces sp. NPDC047014 TaxID=3155736 RepID=UPI0033ED484F